MTASTRRLVANQHVMGTVTSLHVVVRDDVDGPRDAATHPLTAGAVAGFGASMRADDALFSPFRADSAVSRLRAGELALADAGPLVAEVEAACRVAREATGGRFDAWWQGWFDPTGYVKGWAVERAFTTHLRPLLAAPGVVAAGVGVGGDLRVATVPGTGWTWGVGVVDPADAGRTVARIELTDGAVASSGTAMRGAHIVDPGSGAPAAVAGRADDVASATVVADTLDVADVWATTAVVAGFADLGWVMQAPTRSGLLVAGDGRTRRWHGAVEIVETRATSHDAGQYMHSPY